MRSTKKGEIAGVDEVYVLDPRKMEVGDIVLITERGSLEDLVIRLFSDGHYSHAAICTQVGLLIEATTAKDGSGGVRRTSVMRFLADKQLSMRVLRLRENVPNRRVIAGEAALQAELMLHRRYWMNGACLSVIYKNLNDFFPGVIPPNKHQGFFCSHLVAEAYKLAHMDLLGPGVLPEHTLPNEFLNSTSACSKLQEVTHEVVQRKSEATARANVPSADESPHTQIEQAIYQQVLVDPEVLTIIEKYGPKVLPGPEELLDVLEATQDQRLDEIMERALDDIISGYQQLFEIHRSKSESVYEIQRIFINGTQADISNTINVMEALRAILKEDVAHRESDVKQNEDRYNKNPGLKTFQKRLAFSIKFRDYMRKELELLEKQRKLTFEYLFRSGAILDLLNES
jgi:hypothetical protein